MDVKSMMLALVTFGIIPSSIASEKTTVDLQAKGWDVAKLVDQADSGWRDEEVTASMILRSKGKSEIVRSLRTQSLEVDGDGDKTLVVFDKPRDVRGTVFLTHSHKSGNDDQWLFLPALKRVKRISSANRSGPFMGSEFAFEDLASEEIERYSYLYKGEEKCAGELMCHVYHRFPVDENSGYSKQTVYADTEHLRIHKIEYFDRKESHLKTLKRTGYEKFGRYWRATNWEMVNHQKEKSTFVEWKNREFRTGLDANDFTKARMNRVR